MNTKIFILSDTHFAGYVIGGVLSTNSDDNDGEYIFETGSSVLTCNGYPVNYANGFIGKNKPTNERREWLDMIDLPNSQRYIDEVVRAGAVFKDARHALPFFDPRSSPTYDVYFLSNLTANDRNVGVFKFENYGTFSDEHGNSSTVPKQFYKLAQTVISAQLTHSLSLIKHTQTAPKFGNSLFHLSITHNGFDVLAGYYGS